MNINYIFSDLPPTVQQEAIELIDKVNRLHLHCTEGPLWDQFVKRATHEIAKKYFKKKEAVTEPVSNPDKIEIKKTDRQFDSIFSLTGVQYQEGFTNFRNKLQSIYYDCSFTDKIAESAQNHLFNPLKHNGELLGILMLWIEANIMFLPLGEHLIPAFKRDMQGDSLFCRHHLNQLIIIPEAKSEQAERAMRAFLADVRAINDRERAKVKVNPDEPPTAVILSVKEGAGGHTAPSKAMAARIKELGYRVVEINYDTDLNQEYDPFRMLGITFENNKPMTRELFNTQWISQKHNTKVSKIIQKYVDFHYFINPSLYRSECGKDLFTKQILPLNPKLIVTTLAYHWTWKSLAFRLAGVKTLLVASDVFFHYEAMQCWNRQHDFAPALRNIHFTTMTDDLELLRSMGKAHDEYFIKKHPHAKHDLLSDKFTDLQLDDQITVIGAPINPSFAAVTSESEIKRLREKWGVPENGVSVCISRGKMGFDNDLEEALKGYRTKDDISCPLILHVLCGENEPFYNRLMNGEYDDLGPNIKIVPHRLLDPEPCAEIRALSIVDDIKAGGASTFEGWYLNAQGAKTQLLLTPGPKLWWELANCWAMQKWKVGSLVNHSKIAILEKLIREGVPPVTHPFPDWKKPFDQIVHQVMKA